MLRIGRKDASQDYRQYTTNVRNACETYTDFGRLTLGHGFPISASLLILTHFDTAALAFGKQPVIIPGK